MGEVISWVLVVLAVHQTNASDIPGKVELEFQTRHHCEQVLQTMTYRLKFNSYKVIGRCERK